MFGADEEGNIFGMDEERNADVFGSDSGVFEDALTSIPAAIVDEERNADVFGSDSGVFEAAIPAAIVDVHAQRAAVHLSESRLLSRRLQRSVLEALKALVAWWRNNIPQQARTNEQVWSTLNARMQAYGLQRPEPFGSDLGKTARGLVMLEKCGKRDIPPMSLGPIFDHLATCPVCSGAGHLLYLFYRRLKDKDGCIDDACLALTKVCSGYYTYSINL
jgi:hypothetical protein